jgi:soluble lytic murein transglycosylase-like protein
VEPAPAPEALPPVAPEPLTSALEGLADAVAALLGAGPASAAPATAPKPAPATAPKPAPTRSPLDARAPRRAELDRYLPQVAELLRDAASQVFEHGGLGPERRDFFRHLVLASAWQESCWRQYVERRGQIEPLRSSTGALGLMQVSPRVWRGFYAVDGLARSIRYNAHAGSEILLHYLRDYALARGEEASGGPDALARATYAAYNGGPSHLRRYREPQRWPASLAAIDRSFLEKFRAVAAGRELRVRECFPG